MTPVDKGDALAPLPGEAMERSSPPAKSLVLDSGRRIEVTSQGDNELLVIRSKDDICMLTVTLTDQGPVFRVAAAALELVAPRSLSVSCGELRVEAKEAISLRGQSVDVTANLGGVQIRADDDVRIDGERVLLNSSDPPTNLSWREYLERAGEERLLEGRRKEE